MTGFAADRELSRIMGGVIGDLLPLAIGVAISAIPLIAVILMLLSGHAIATSTGFLLGWITGIVLVTTVILILIAQAGSPGQSEPSTISSVLKIVFGAALLLMAVWQWLGRPKAGQPGTMPKWMNAIESFNFAKAAGLGFLLSAFNPKNLVLCLGAGTTIGAAELSATSDVIAVAVFTAIAASTIAIPVIGYLCARQRVQQPLSDLRDWLTQNNAAVMATVLLLIGVVLIGKGITGLSA